MVGYNKNNSENNPIKDIDELLSMDLEKLKGICLEFFGTEGRMCENLRMFLKLNVEELEKICRIGLT